MGCHCRCFWIYGWYIFAGVLDSVLGASAGVMTSVLLLGAGVVVELIILSVMRKITNKI